MDCNNKSSPLPIIKKNIKCIENRMIEDFSNFKYEINENKCNSIPFSFSKNSLSNNFDGKNPFFQTPPDKHTLFQFYMDLYCKTNLMKKTL